jgi:hypothetical protein
MGWACRYIEGEKRSNATGMRADLVDLGHRWLFSPANISTPTSTSSFRVNMLSPGFRGCILAKNMSFGRFSAGAHHQDRSAVVGGL